jgi:hypothetical protein
MIAHNTKGLVMSKNLKYVKLLDLEHSIKLVLCDYPQRPLKLKIDLNDTIAITRDEVVAIYEKQQNQSKLRQRELDKILQKEIARCRKLTQLTQD